MINAKATIEKFCDLLCKKDVKVSEFEDLIQASYKKSQESVSNKIDRSIVWDEKEKKFVSNKDRSKVIHLRGWQHSIEGLLNKKPKSIRILRVKPFGTNMINFEIEINTRFMKLIYSSPNMVRENGVWQINPISALPKKYKKKK